MQPAYGATSRPPSQTDPVVAAASQVIGGPVGRYAGPWAPRTLAENLASAWQPVAAMLMAAASVAMAAGVLTKAHCVSAGWNTPDQFWHACYSDLPVVFRSSGMAQGSMPLVEGSGSGTVDQPPLATLALWLVGLLTPDGKVDARLTWYFGIWAVVLTVLLGLVVLLTVRSSPAGRWTAAHVAVSPVILTVALVSVDLVAVVLTSLALWLWSRERPVVAGVALGLAVVTRSYPLVVLAAIGLLCLRTGHVAVWKRTALAAAATFLAVFVPAYLLWPEAAMAPYASWWDSGPSYGSPWMIPQLLDQAPRFLFQDQVGFTIAPGVVTVLAVLGWLLALALGAALALGSRRRPTVAEVSMVMLVVVMLTAKALPVQAALWVLPFLALTRTWWRDHLIWAGAEILAFVGVWLYIAGFTTANRGLPAHVYGLLLAVRLATLAYLAVRVWSGAWRREGLPSPDPDAVPDANPDTVPDADPDADPRVVSTVASRVVTDVAPDVPEHDELAGAVRGAADRLVVAFR